MRLRSIVDRGRHAGSGHSSHPGPAGGGAQLPAHGKWVSDGQQTGNGQAFVLENLVVLPQIARANVIATFCLRPATARYSVPLLTAFDLLPSICGENS